LFPEERAEISQISCNEMSRPGRDRGLENRPILFGKADPAGERGIRSLRHDLSFLEQALQSGSSNVRIEISPSFLGRVP